MSPQAPPRSKERWEPDRPVWLYMYLGRVLLTILVVAIVLSVFVGAPPEDFSDYFVVYAWTGGVLLAAFLVWYAVRRLRD